MSLSSCSYLAWLLVLTSAFCLLPIGNPRRVLLLAASYIFYALLSHGYIAVLALITALSFFGALALTTQPAQTRLPTLFAVLLGVVLTPLLVFKYANFLLGIGDDLISLAYPISVQPLSLALPIGISFFTFLAVGYLIDVYLEIIEPENDPIRFALFLSFFPLVTAGPIERAGSFLPQMNLEGRFSAANTLQALKLIFWGLFLKLVFADYLEMPLPAFFSNPEGYIALDHLFAMTHYVFALYADFAGYSLIAIGSARLFGLKVRHNFMQPLLSTNVPEFWRNWHISLSSWVRDYLFAPMRMSWRSYKGGMIGALVASFVILGLWHGAGWGFLAFGAMHGVLVALSTLTLERRNAFWAEHGIPPGVLHGVRVVTTFFVVMLTFVVFRAQSLSDALTIYRHIFSFELLNEIKLGFQTVISGTDYLPTLRFSRYYYQGWFLLAALFCGDFLVKRHWPLERFPLSVQICVYNVGVVLIMYKWLEGNVAVPFQYYKF